MITPYDEELFAASHGVGVAFDEVNWLEDHIRISGEERQRFLDNEIENPLFTYRPQTPNPTYQEDIESAYKLLAHSTAPAVVIDLYERKLDMLQRRNELVAASLGGDDRAYFNISTELYGKPHKRHFSYVAKQVIALSKEQKKKHPAAARRLLKVLSKINVEGVDIEAGILPPVEPVGHSIKRVSEVQSIFEEVMARYEIDDWSVEVDSTENRRHFVVLNGPKKIIIPSEQHLLSRPVPPTDIHMQALAEHEIGVHVRRSHEAQRLPLRLLEVGFDGYLKGEEGLASYVQQQVEGADEFYGFDRYLAAGLAVGMDGEERDFRGVFGLMTDYYTLKYEEEGELEDHPAPFRAAWDVCVRLFRGTTGQTAGCVYTKDIVYLEGNIGIWHLLSEKPHVFPYLFLGKYNPLLKRHVTTLQTLEIMPQW